MKATTPESDPFCLRPLGPADAEALGRCFERCYGTSYVDAGFYDPVEIRARLADGRRSSIIATHHAGEVVGHMGLSRARGLGAGRGQHRGRSALPQPPARRPDRRAPDRPVPRARPHGLPPLSDDGAPDHAATGGGGVETGLLLQYIPATTDYRELSGESHAGRLAAVVVYQPIGAAPEREVYAPETYRLLAENAYRRARLPRRLRAPGTRCTGVGELVHEEARAIRALIEAEGASP